MKIAKLECEEFAGVPNGAYSFLAPNRAVPNNLTLIAGMRGSGKTRFLEAIVALKELVGAYRASPPESSLWEHGASRGKLGGTFLLSDEEKDLAELPSNELLVEFGMGELAGITTKISATVRKLFARYDHDEAHGKIEYFSASRLLPPFGEPTTVAQEAFLRLGSQPTKYSGLVPSLIEMSLGDGARALKETTTRGMLLGLDAPDSLIPYRAALANLLPELRLRGAGAGDDEKPTLLFERANGAVVPWYRLSDSQKQALLLAGTMVRIGLSQSIILLDEPELHTHVADQAKLIETLATIGNDNQWIVATGSSEIMKAARRDQMIALPSASRSSSQLA
jgi:hypothetical protein